MNLKKIHEGAIFRFGNKNTRARIARNWGVDIGENCNLLTMGFGSEPYLISIGNQCTISSGVKFVTHDGGIGVLRRMGLFTGTKFGQIVIHDNCFIGLDSIILPNIEIGPNSIVGAGSVVTKNVPPNCIYAGNPARYICSLDEYRAKCMGNYGDIGTGVAHSKNQEQLLKRHFKRT